MKPSTCLATENGQEVGTGPSQAYQNPPWDFTYRFYIQGEKTLSLSSEIIKLDSLKPRNI